MPLCTADLHPHRALLSQMIRRDVQARYRGSALGLAWTFVTPLLMLGVYTFVFAGVFGARWGAQGSDTHTLGFALHLFAGLILHGFLAENLGRAPGVITAHANYVKKVVFPLQILPPMLLGSAMFHLLMNLAVLLVAVLLIGPGFSMQWIWLPAVLIPLALVALAANFLLASLGVFLRDIGQLMGLLTTLLMFLSPVFYPLDALPEAVRPWIALNPLSLPIEALRNVLLDQQAPRLAPLALYTALALLGCGLCHAWFQRTRPAFADVV